MKTHYEVEYEPLNAEYSHVIAFENEHDANTLYEQLRLANKICDQTLPRLYRCEVAGNSTRRFDITDAYEQVLRASSDLLDLFRNN